MLQANRRALAKSAKFSETFGQIQSGDLPPQFRAILEDNRVGKAYDSCCFFAQGWTSSSLMTHLSGFLSAYHRAAPSQIATLQLLQSFVSFGACPMAAHLVPHCPPYTVSVQMLHEQVRTYKRELYETQASNTAHDRQTVRLQAEVKRLNETLQVSSQARHHKVMQLVTRNMLLLDLSCVAVAISYYQTSLL